MAALGVAGYGLGREAPASGQRADELDKRLLHIDAEVLPHAFGLGFELEAAQPAGELALRRLPGYRVRRA